MNSLEIDSILSKNNITKKYFTGVFSSNDIEPNNNYPYCLIANTDKNTLPGTHWVAIFVLTPSTAEFFDSLGNVPNKNIEKFLSRFSNVKQNFEQLQTLFSDACGHYSIAFLIFRCKGLDFKESIKALKLFSDLTIKLFIKKFIKYA